MNLFSGLSAFGFRFRDQREQTAEGDGGGDAAARAAFGRHDDVPPLCGDDAETLGRQRYALVEIRHDPQPKSQPRMLTTTQA